jgi:hypothetical protein
MRRRFGFYVEVSGTDSYSSLCNANPDAIKFKFKSLSFDAQI